MLVLFLLGTVELQRRADWKYTLKALLTVFEPGEWGPQETQPVGFWSSAYEFCWTSCRLTEPGALVWTQRANV